MTPRDVAHDMTMEQFAYWRRAGMDWRDMHHALTGRPIDPGEPVSLLQTFELLVIAATLMQDAQGRVA